MNHALYKMKKTLKTMTKKIVKKNKDKMKKSNFSKKMTVQMEKPNN